MAWRTAFQVGAARAVDRNGSRKFYSRRSPAWLLRASGGCDDGGHVLVGISLARLWVGMDFQVCGKRSTFASLLVFGGASLFSDVPNMIRKQGKRNTN